jgi:hypothetical protein
MPYKSKIGMHGDPPLTGLAIRRSCPDHCSPSFIILDQFLIDPMASVVPSPDPAVYESAGDRSARNDNGQTCQTSAMPELTANFRTDQYLDRLQSWRRLEAK